MSTDTFFFLLRRWMFILIGLVWAIMGPWVQLLEPQLLFCSCWSSLDLSPCLWQFNWMFPWISDYVRTIPSSTSITVDKGSWTIKWTQTFAVSFPSFTCIFSSSVVKIGRKSISCLHMYCIDLIVKMFLFNFFQCLLDILVFLCKEVLINLQVQTRCGRYFYLLPSSSSKCLLLPALSWVAGRLGAHVRSQGDI